MDFVDLADPLLLIVVVGIVAIAAVSVWVSFAPFDRAIARAHRRELKRNNRRDEADRVASSGRECTELPVADFAAPSPGLSLIALFLSLVPVGVSSWFYVRPYIYESWDESSFLGYFFFMALMVSVPLILLAISLGVLGILRYKTAFSKLVCAFTIAVALVYVLWLLWMFN